MQVYDSVEAEFRPRKTDDLRSDGVPPIGFRTRWEAMWIIEEYDNKQYAGELAMRCVEFPRWVPSGDLFIFT